MSVLRGAVTSYEGSLLLVCAVWMIVWQVAGLVTARQWYLLPLAIGLSALAAFLVNPVADANSLFDLRAIFSRSSLLSNLVLLQTILVALSLVAGLQATKVGGDERWRIVLGAIHCIPAVPVVVAALLVQQAWLAQQVGSRPEFVGLSSSGLVGGLILVGCFVFLPVNRSVRAKVHLLSCVAVIIIVSLIPGLNAPIPAAQDGLANQSALTSLLPFLLLAGLGLGAGWVLQGRSLHRSLR
ncbi:MAG: hypothetical protein AAGG44_05670 [Planctomycetota bacterium]